jgi:PTH1 family peptidyl-tRNA hydrolase
VSASSFRLIVGLGNPGAEYRQTRHNAGFWFVDRLAEDARASWQRQSRQQCELARVRIGAHELWLMKPTTFMNGSGAAVQSVAAFYRIAPAEMLVVHDEIDLPPGTVRLKLAGGHGGHNGLRDIMACIGADFWRLRLGVGHPGDKDRVVDAVLSRASSAEQALIDKALARGLAALPSLLDGASQTAMQQLHSQTDAPPVD